MTDNPDIQYRHKRVITPIKETKYKRVTKIKELINYCKFRVGEIEVCEKPSATVISILSNYKYGKLDLIPKGYLEAIESYKDLIDRAIKVDGRSLKRKKVQHKPRKINSYNIAKSNKASMSFEVWLVAQIENPVEKRPSDRKFSSFVTYYLNHNRQSFSCHPKYAQGILDKYYEQIKNMKNRKGVLVEKDSKSIEIPCDERTIEKTLETQQVFDTFAQNTIDTKVTPVTIEQSKTKDISLNDFVKALKDMGIKKFNIEF